jgi:tetratricopeptide (TPR) repeat protein
MKKHLLVLATILFAAILAVPAMAQTDEEKDKIEYDTYMRVHNAGNVDRDSAKTLALAKEYIAKYPSGKYVDRAKGAIQWAMNDLFSVEFTKGNYDGAIAIGKEILESDPSNLLTHYQLVFVGDTQFAQDKWNNTDEVLAHADKAEQLIKAGSKPATFDDTQWAAEKNNWLAIIYRTRARVAQKNQRQDEALDLYKKSVEFAPTDAATLYCMSAIYVKKYESARDAFDKLPQDKKEGEAGTAALEDLNKAMDAVIDVFARVLAFSEGKPSFEGVRKTAQGNLVALYTFRHKDKPDGWQQLIAQYKAANGQPVQKN